MTLSHERPRGCYYSRSWMLLTFFHNPFLPPAFIEKDSCSGFITNFLNCLRAMRKKDGGIGCRQGLPSPGLQERLSLLIRRLERCVFTDPTTVGVELPGGSRPQPTLFVQSFKEIPGIRPKSLRFLVKLWQQQTTHSAISPSPRQAYLSLAITAFVLESSVRKGHSRSLWL